MNLQELKKYLLKYKSKNYMQHGVTIEQISQLFSTFEVFHLKYGEEWAYDYQAVNTLIDLLASDVVKSIPKEYVKFAYEDAWHHTKVKLRHRRPLIDVGFQTHTKGYEECESVQEAKDAFRRKVNRVNLI